MLHNILHLTGSGKKERFLRYHCGAVIIFGLLYWIQDNIMSSFPKLVKDIGLGKTHPPADSLYYWLWFSLITQTTVGYGGAVDEQGGRIAFDNIPNKVFKALNFLQLVSVFWITAQLL